MGRTRRSKTDARIAGRRRATVVAVVLGGQVRAARRRRRWRQRDLAARIGTSQAHVSQIELGQVGGAPLEVWFALSEALQVPLRVEFGRDRLEEPADAGHLAIQELILRLGRAAGFGRTFELPTRPANPRLSVDVCLRDDARRLFVLVEAWNSFGDIGASVRGTNRKIAEAHALVVAVGGDGWYRVAACWVVRDTARNRELAARYPEVFGVAFPGSSREWVAALSRGALPPQEMGLVWCDVAATRLRAWRRPSGVSVDRGRRC